MTAETFFGQLKARCAADWESYTNHEFVNALAAGTLPLEAFRHYLIQDYLFLHHFARAYALAAYKSETIEEMRHAAAGMAAIVDEELDLHVSFCRDWGLGEADMRNAPEDPACIAYTRFVLECGNAGDLLDLHAALAPCVVGYAEIGTRLAGDTATRSEGNPYRAWIEMYAGEDYQKVAQAEIEAVENLARRRGGAQRIETLAAAFGSATRLEIGFWQMGLDAAAGLRA